MKVLSNGPMNGRKGRLILGFFFFYFLLHWGTGILMFREKLGFSYASVVRYYLGDPDLFMNPRSFAGLLEVTHFHLFAMGFFFVVFGHLLLFTPWRPALQTVLIWVLAAALLADMAGGWLVRYLAQEFAWFKLGAFWTLQAVSVLLLGGLALNLLRSRAGEPKN